MDAMPPVRPTAGPTDPDAALRKVAQDLEANFLAEMLRSAGLGKTPEAFGGGAGEDHFASFLVTEHAKAIVAKGGIGLSEAIFNTLKETQDGS